MKLLVLMPLVSPWARNFIQEIILQGHEVFVVDPSSVNNSRQYLNNGNDFQNEQITQFIKSLSGVKKVTSVLGYLAGMFKAIFVLKKSASIFKPDLLLVLYGGIWGFIAYLSGIKPFIMYVVGSDILFGGKMKHWITKIVLNASALVYSNGINLGHQALKIAPNANLKNLYLGINTDNFLSKEKKNASPVTIICTRGFKSVYNNKFLIDALNLISLKCIPEIEIIFTSTGPQLEDVKKYANKVLEASMREKVVFLGGIPTEELISKLQCAHIYVSLSLSDGASISLMEALACGLFPILSDIPANREWIHNNNGILVPLSNSKALADAIIKASLNEEWRSEAGKFNRRLATEIADKKKNTKIFLHTLGDVVFKNSKNHVIDKQKSNVYKNSK